MTSHEREAFLADVHVGVIAIAEEGRAPLAVPVWHSCEPGGDVRVLMQSDSRKALGIEAANSVTVSMTPQRWLSADFSKA